MLDQKYIKQTLQEWLDEGKKRFGADFANWRFKCPACGHVITPENKGIDVFDFADGNTDEVCKK